jgi:uncharacterized membrane protein
MDLEMSHISFVSAPTALDQWCALPAVSAVPSVGGGGAGDGSGEAGKRGGGEAGAIR